MSTSILRKTRRVYPLLALVAVSLLCLGISASFAISMSDMIFPSTTIAEPYPVDNVEVRTEELTPLRTLEMELEPKHEKKNGGFEMNSNTNTTVVDHTNKLELSVANTSISVNVNVINDTTILHRMPLVRNLGDAKPADQKDYAKDHPPVIRPKMPGHFILVPEYKIMFCYIEKVGCSMFNQLFRVLRMYHPNTTIDELKFIAEKRYGRNSPRHFGWNLDDLAAAMQSSDWTKVLFYRDPADRFLSAFRSKCGGADAGGPKVCSYFGSRIEMQKDGTKRRVPLLGGDPQSFQQAAEILANSTQHVMKNQHFLKSTEFCGGLQGTIDYYDMIQPLEKHTVNDHITTLLNHVGVDAILTKGLVERVVATGGALSATDVKFFKRKHKIRLRSSVSKRHNTAARDKFTAKEYFRDDKHLKMVQDVYKDDYHFFGITPPSIDEL